MIIEDVSHGMCHAILKDDFNSLFTVTLPLAYLPTQPFLTVH
jgi:hypothetical protein